MGWGDPGGQVQGWFAGRGVVPDIPKPVLDLAGVLSTRYS